MMQARAKLGNRAFWPLAVLLTAALLLAGLTSSAAAGNKGNKEGNKGTGKTAHGKCHKKPNKAAKSSAKKKCNKKKANNKPKHRKPAPPAPPVAPPPPPPPAVNPPAPAALALNPASFDFGTVPHGGFAACVADPDPDCPTHAFTVTNTGGSASGVPTASIVEIHNPEIDGPAAFRITANSCTAALAPGASCSITVKFAPNSNAGDETFSSRLDVTASPGSTVSSALSGMAT